MYSVSCDTNHVFILCGNCQNINMFKPISLENDQLTQKLSFLTGDVIIYASLDAIRMQWWQNVSAHRGLGPGPSTCIPILGLEMVDLNVLGIISPSSLLNEVLAIL